MDPDGSPSVMAQWRTVPNLLSFGRLAATPLLAWLILSGRTVLATVLFGLMAFSDYLDGTIARATNTVTDLGTVLDPVSDRVLVMTVLVVLMRTGTLPAWLGLPVLLRDIVLSLAFLALQRRGFGKPKVRQVGKSATFALLTALPMLVLGGVMRPIGLWLFTIGAVLYFIAFYRYLTDVRGWLQVQSEPF